jgi:hypothetical protein
MLASLAEMSKNGVILDSLPHFSTPIYQVMVENSTIMKYKQNIILHENGVNRNEIPQKNHTDHAWQLSTASLFFQDNGPYYSSQPSPPDSFRLQGRNPPAGEAAAMHRLP